MKIAIPTRNGFVDDHFGHADQYTIYSISADRTVIGSELLNATEGCGCKSGIAGDLARKGVSILLAGNIGGGAIHHLGAAGIEVVRGCSGEAGAVLAAFLQGTIIDSEQTCHQHEGCDHHGHSA